MLLPVPGDGMCFFQSIQLALMLVYNKHFTIEQMQMAILGYIRGNKEEISKYYIGDPFEDAKKFIKDKQFNKPVVDLIVAIAPKAFRINLYIYQEGSKGQVQVHKVVNPNIKFEVHLKFTGDDKNSIVNHYEALVPVANTVPLLGLAAEAEKVIDLTQDVADEIPKGAAPQCPPPTYAEVLKTYKPPTPTGPEMEKAKNDDEDEAALLEYKFPLHAFKNVKEEWVEYIPGDIDGKHIYKVKTGPKKWYLAQADQRNFQMNKTRCRKSAKNILVKVGTCHGSPFCPNPQCSFYQCSSDTNETHFQNMDEEKVCFSCGIYADYVPCGARKRTVYDYETQELTVWHIGKHLCKPDLDNKRHIEKVRAAVKKHKHVGPVEAKLIEVGDAAYKGDIAEGRRRARDLNWKRMRVENGIQIREQNTDPQCLESVGVYKMATDENDPYLIWKIMDRRFSSNKKVDMVMKSALEMVMMMDQMNQDGPDNPLQQMEVFFDGAHKRVSGYISLALWATHIAMRKLLRLASCEVRCEKTSDIKEFWIAINEMLTAYKGKETFFNPKCIMVDENGANFNGIEEVFGLQYKTEKVVSCQRHFQANAILKARLIPYSYREDWIDTCFKLCSCITVAQYNELMEKLQKYASMFPEVGPFIQWWDVRKYHIFAPFRRYGYTRSNLAEVGNSMCKRRNQLYITEAAKDDTTSMLCQVEDYKAFLRQEVNSSGTAPNDVARAQDIRREQMRMAKDFAAELRNPQALEAAIEESQSQEAFRPGRCKHKPGKKGIQGTVIDPNTGKKKKAPRRKKTGPAVPPSVLDISLNLAREVMNEEDDDGENISSTPPEENQKPTIELYMTSVHRCQGCPDPIDKNKLIPPKDLIIRTRGSRIWRDKRSHQLRSSFGKLYFHLSMTCLKNKYGQKYSKEDLTIEDDTLQLLTKDHYRHLKKEGFLSVVMRKDEERRRRENENN